MSKMSDYDKEKFAVEHHFATGLYAKQMAFSPDYNFKSHKHNFDHMSILAQGCVLIEVDGVTTRHSAPAVINMPKDTVHRVQALEPCVWYCIHATDLTDPDEIDEVTCERDRV